MLSIRRTRGKYTLARGAMLRGAQITYNGQSPLITYQSFGLDKKLSNPIGLLNFLEVPPGFEPGDRGVADLCLTTWLWHHIYSLIIISQYIPFVNGFCEIIWGNFAGRSPRPRSRRKACMASAESGMSLDRKVCMKSIQRQIHADA